MSVAKGKLRILYVDDNPDDHALFQRAISRTCPGCEIEESYHPADAVEKLGRKKLK